MRAICVTVAALASVAGCARPPALQVPPGSADPRLDGRLGPTEWSAALRVPLRPRGSARILGASQGGGLAIALAQGGRGLATVYVHEGDRVRLLHASAALGEAVYARVPDGRWRLAQGFVWACRDGGEGAAARAERARFWDQHGWLGNVAGGAGADRELRLAAALVRGQQPLPVVLVSYVHPGQIAAWPPDVGDDTTREELLRGETPEWVRLRPERWGRLWWR